MHLIQLEGCRTFMLFIVICVSGMPGSLLRLALVMPGSTGSVIKPESGMFDKAWWLFSNTLATICVLHNGKGKSDENELHDLEECQKQNEFFQLKTSIDIREVTTITIGVFQDIRHF